MSNKKIIKRLTMDELVENAKKFLKGKPLQSNNRTTFEKALKKAVAPKQRGSKGVQT